MKEKRKENCNVVETSFFLYMDSTSLLTNLYNIFKIVHSGNCSPEQEINVLHYCHSIAVEFKTMEEIVLVCASVLGFCVLAVRTKSQRR